MSEHSTTEHQTAEQVIACLGLQPHPEGGFFCETFRDPATVAGRSVGTAIYFLLKAGQQSSWHRVDATEIWHWYAGAPLALLTAGDDGKQHRTVLGNGLKTGQRPQAIVAANAWQSAQSLGEWTLVGCTVSPGFEFAHFELAPEGRAPR